MEYKFNLIKFNSFNFLNVQRKHTTYVFSHSQAELSAGKYNMMTISILLWEKVMVLGC